MSRKHSFVITLSNNNTEKEGINYLLQNHTGFFQIDRESKKEILLLLNLDTKYSKTFDLIYIPNLKNTVFIDNLKLKTHLKEIHLIELKTTKKYLPENPTGFFFGATKNEFDFAMLLGDRFRFCFVCLNPKSQSFKLLTLTELERSIKNKRIQYQINL